MKIEEKTLEQLFINARSVAKFSEQSVSKETLEELIKITLLGPTAFNAQPARFTFIQSSEAKEKLRNHLMEGNIEKTMKAPLTVIVSTDYDFYLDFHRTFPVADIKGLFEGNKEAIESTAFRNATLQGGYFIIAARALGLSTGPMSGFNNKTLDEEFFKGKNIKSNFLINLGYEDKEDKLYERLKRYDFDDVATII